jgi:cellulose biosynthesis protein BcsQ
MMPQRISVISSKGGAGETTVAIFLAGEYALRRQNVLMIDADDRKNLSERRTLSIIKDKRLRAVRGEIEAVGLPCEHTMWN